MLTLSLLLYQRFFFKCETYQLKCTLQLTWHKDKSKGSEVINCTVLVRHAWNDRIVLPLLENKTKISLSNTPPPPSFTSFILAASLKIANLDTILVGCQSNCNPQ